MRSFGTRATSKYASLSAAPLKYGDDAFADRHVVFTPGGIKEQNRSPNLTVQSVKVTRDEPILAPNELLHSSGHDHTAFKFDRGVRAFL